MTARFLFVGEQRSRRAIRLGVRWEDGRLSGRTLHDALRATGLDPSDQTFVNLFREAPGRRRVDRAALARIRGLAASGLPVVAMGCKVQEALVRAGVPHLPLVHPAARGVIRRKAVYQAHVASVLSAWTHRFPTAA